MKKGRQTLAMRRQGKVGRISTSWDKFLDEIKMGGFLSFIPARKDQKRKGENRLP